MSCLSPNRAAEQTTKVEKAATAMATTEADSKVSISNSEEKGHRCSAANGPKTCIRERSISSGEKCGM